MNRHHTTSCQETGPDDHPCEQEFELQVADRTVPCLMLSPPTGKVAGDPALVLNLCGGRRLGGEPLLLSSRFLEQGHRSITFDVISHGTRTEELGMGLEGWRTGLLTGVDPFAWCVEEARAVIDHCIGSGLARSGRIVVTGGSRFGYMAARILAADRRVIAAACLAPVTDWRDLKEFAEERDSQMLADLALTNFLEGLAGRHLYLAIGWTDERAGVKSCVALHRELTRAIERPGPTPSCVTLSLTDDPGHSIPVAYYEEAATFLLRCLGPKTS